MRTPMPMKDFFTFWRRNRGVTSLFLLLVFIVCLSLIFIKLSRFCRMNNILQSIYCEATVRVPVLLKTSREGIPSSQVVNTSYSSFLKNKYRIYLCSIIPQENTVRQNTMKIAKINESSCINVRLTFCTAKTAALSLPASVERWGFHCSFLSKVIPKKTVESTCIDYDGWLNIRIQHSLNCNGEKYCNRGTISLKSTRAGTSVIEQIPFSEQHINELKELAAVNGFYTLRSLVTSADSKESEFLSSVKAKTFLDNGLSDVINAWVLPNGAVIAVSFQVNNSSQTRLPRSVGNEYKITSNFYLRQVEQAAVPDTASYIQKLEREREAREKGELKDNRSFLAKYWMYIVPIAIFVMISGATNPEASAQAAR